MLSPPTGQLRRYSTGSLSPDDDLTMENLDNDEDWDTDLETDGTITNFSRISIYDCKPRVKRTKY